MKSIFTPGVVLIFIAVFCAGFSAAAQNISSPNSKPDTLRTIQIIRGNNLRQKTIDSSTSLQTIAGNVILKEGLTLFYCDSASINKQTNVLEAFGNIHINQNDSINTYSQYLKYIGKDRVAHLKKDVRLTDGKGTLYTQELEYDLKSSIGKYFNGGRVVNGKTVLTSTEGVYYADTKDVYFKKNVHLVDPKYDVRNDTLLYNTLTQITSWNTATVIKSKNGGDVYSSNGTYDLKNGKAFFGNRTVIRDSTRTYVADSMASDDSTGVAQLEGNAVVKDSANGYTVLGRTIFVNKKDDSFLATGKPVLIFKGDARDSTFISADTLFSGVERRDSLGRKIVVSKDTIKKTTVVNIPDSALAKAERPDSSQNKSVVAYGQLKDSVAGLQPEGIVVTKDSLGNNALNNKNSSEDTVAVLKKGDSSFERQHKRAVIETIATAKKDSSVKKSSVQNRRPSDSLSIAKDATVLVKTDTSFTGKDKNDSIADHSLSISAAVKDSLNDTTAVHILKDTAIRYFIAFHKVRIFNDSLQSVCDSLYYSSEDSIFRLYQEPLVFSNNSQIAGDTIFMYTKNKKPARLYVFNNGIIINKANERMYNQIAGRTLNGYFKDGELDYMRAKGSPAESVYYPQDDDSAYIGMNRSKGDVIDIFFVDKAVNKVKFINEVDGTLFPLRQIPEDQKFLKNYKWLESRRPKNKLELFE